MAHLTTQTVDRTGEVVTFASATGGGDTFDPGEKVILRVHNGDSGSHTVTVASQVPCNQGSTHNVAVAVAASATKDIGPFPASRFADAGGVGHISYDGVTSVTIAVVRHA